MFKRPLFLILFLMFLINHNISQQNQTKLKRTSPRKCTENTSLIHVLSCIKNFKNTIINTTHLSLYISLACHFFQEVLFRRNFEFILQNKKNHARNLNGDTELSQRVAQHLEIFLCSLYFKYNRPMLILYISYYSTKSFG